MNIYIYMNRKEIIKKKLKIKKLFNSKERSKEDKKNYIESINTINKLLSKEKYNEVDKILNKLKKVFHVNKISKNIFSFTNNKYNPIRQSTSTNVIINCSAGSYPNEVSWRIVDSNYINIPLFQGGAPFTSEEEMDFGSYTVIAGDSFGDGWNGSVLTIVDNKDTNINYLNYTLDYGDIGSFNFTIGNSEGCTDPEACNYNPDATQDDGSCCNNNFVSYGFIEYLPSTDEYKLVEYTGKSLITINGKDIVIPGVAFSSSEICADDGTYNVVITQDFETNILFVMINCNDIILLQAETSGSYQFIIGNSCSETFTYTQVPNGNYTKTFTASEGQNALVTINGNLEDGYDFLYVTNGDNISLNPTQNTGAFVDAVFTSNDDTISVNITNDDSIQNGNISLAFACDLFEVEGCMASNACNYNPDATIDNGCVFCTGDQLCENGECIQKVYGCMDSEACNYDPDATEDDESCCSNNNFVLYGFIQYVPSIDEYKLVKYTGNSSITINGKDIVNPESQFSPSETCADDGIYNVVITQDFETNIFFLIQNCTDDPYLLANTSGSYQFTIGDSGMEGCMDPLSCNYNPDATEDDESCEYPEENYNCEGNCIVNVDCDGICGGDAEEDDCGVCNGDGTSCIIEGCMDSDACNYNPDATKDDDSCEYVLENECDCDGNVVDCAGVCGGDAEENKNGDCITDDDDDDNSLCHPSCSTVRLQDGSIRKMSELQLNDMVWNGKDYEEVIGFSHADPDCFATYLEIKTEDNNKLYISPEHYLYANNELTLPKDVKVGDTVTTDKITKVSSIKEVILQGAYHPVTYSTDLVVDNILCSVKIGSSPIWSANVWIPIVYAFYKLNLPTKVKTGYYGKSMWHSMWNTYKKIKI